MPAAMMPAVIGHGVVMVDPVHDSVEEDRAWRGENQVYVGLHEGKVMEKKSVFGAGGENDHEELLEIFVCVQSKRSIIALTTHMITESLSQNARAPRHGLPDKQIPCLPWNRENERFLGVTSDVFWAKVAILLHKGY